MSKPTPEIVIRALIRTVCDIGQLSPAEIRALDRYVRLGILDKGRGGPFPIVKTVWACKGFDFAADRQAAVDEAMAWAQFDKVAAERQKEKGGFGK